MARKFLFFTDFDGTVTLADSNQILIDNHGFGAAERKARDARIISGETSYRDGARAMYDSVAANIGIAACCDYLRDRVELDPAFAPFWLWCREASEKKDRLEVVVLSGGMEVIIRSLLVGLLGEEHTNEIRIVGNNAFAVDDKPGRIDEAGGWKLHWRDDSRFGHDKSVDIRKFASLPEPERPLMFFAGDGISDYSAARETDLLFAKAGRELVDFCDKGQIPHIPFDDFGLIQKVVREIIEEGLTVDEALRLYGKRTTIPFSSRPARPDRFRLRTFATTSPRTASYGFIGLGNMGLPMAKNLCLKLSSRDSVGVFDMNPESGPRLLRELQEARDNNKGDSLSGVAAAAAAVRVATSAADAARDSDFVITALPAAAHVASALSSIVADSRENPSRMFLDCSTVSPAESRTIAASIPPSHGLFVDAPMSGGVRGATLGTLSFMLGCPDGVVADAERVLLLMGARVLHCGPNGAGLAAKLANNYVLAVENIAVAEAMDLGIRLGVDAKVLAGVLNVSTARCWSSEVNNPVPGVVDSAPAGRDYENGFSVSLMSKDLRLVAAARAAAQASMPSLESVQAVYQGMEERGWASKDFSIVYRHVGGGCASRVDES